MAYDASLVSSRDQIPVPHPDEPRPIAPGSSRSARSTAAWAVACAVTVAVLGACDTGDGKTLSEPTGTLPPVTIATTTTDLPLDGADPLASRPLDASSIDAPLPDDEVSPQPTPFGLIAPWVDAEPIDSINTCVGEDLSPALSWHDVPDGTVDLAITLVDESVDGGAPFVHWAIAGLSPSAGSLSEGMVPLGAIESVNSFGNVGFGGPCPPPGDPSHSYRLTIYALNQQVELADGTAAADLLGFVQNVAIASSDVTGTFAR